MFGDYPQTLPQRISFILLPGFSLLGFSSMVDPLRWANTFNGKQLYRWEIISVDGAPVASSDQLTILADRALGELEDTDLAIVCAGFDPQLYLGKTLLAGLRRLASRGIDMGCQDTGAYLLAAAGLLDNYRTAIHWENLSSFAEEFPKVKVVNDIFEIDRNRFSCSGGLSGLDMMLYLIQAQHGQDMAMAASEELIYSHARGADHPQRMSVQNRLGISNPKLLTVIKLMQRSLENNLTIPELAEEVHISERELERLFRKHLSMTPSHFYRDLRLEEARRLLRQTSRSVTNISVSCGFTSVSHFSRCYQAKYGTSPSRDRTTKI